MEKLDEESASKFINALVKSVQALCHGYLDFHKGIDIIGHINLSVDRESSLHYILEEKVCKSEENSTMFISNSFYAQNQKSELQIRNTCKENVSSETATVHVSSADVREINSVPSDSLVSASHEKTQTESTSTARVSETNTTPVRSVTSTAKRKLSSDSDTARNQTKPPFNSNINLVSKFGFKLPNNSSDAHSSLQSKLLVKQLQNEELNTHTALLPKVTGFDGDSASDLGISLEGSVLEPVGEHATFNPGAKGGDSDEDLDVTFIKEEYVEDEQTACLFENSSGQNFDSRPHGRASSSETVSETSVYPVSHHQPTTGSASATYVPTAHTGLRLDIATAQLYQPSASLSQSHHALPDRTAENETNFNSTMTVSVTQSCEPLNDDQYNPTANNTLQPQANLNQSQPIPAQFPHGFHHPFQTDIQLQPVHFTQPLQDSHIEAQTRPYLSGSCSRRQYSKRWMCTMCSARYSYQSDLKRHVKCRHLDNPRFRCHLCGMGFNLKDHYTGHMGAHNGVKNYACPHCSKKYFYRSDLKRHTKMCHEQNTVSQQFF